MAMVLEEAVERIYQKFASEWGKTCPVAYENKAFTVPKEDKPWCRITVRVFTSEQHNLRNEKNTDYRRVGSIFVQIYTAMNEGTRLSSQLAKKVQDIFEGKAIATGLQCWNSTPRSTGPTEKWVQTSVETEFEYLETK